jgi:hypothetical protein
VSRIDGRRPQSVGGCAPLALGVVVLLGAVACSPSSPPPSSLTVDYYRTHAEEREAELARCGNDPGGLGLTPACVNVREAARIEGVGSLRDLPPMGLPTAGTGPDRSRPR